MLDPAVVLAVRHALTTLRSRDGALGAALAAIRSGADESARHAAAMEAGMALPALAGVGELASREGPELDELILAATDEDDERRQAREVAASLREPQVFRALRRVYPYSYRSPVLDAWAAYRAHLRGLLDREVLPGRGVTVRQLFVSPAAIVPDPQSGSMNYETPVDPIGWMLPRLLRGGTCIELAGEPGVGTSTVVTALADALARREDSYPLLISTLGEGDLEAAIREALAREGFPALLSPRLDVAPTLIVDGGGRSRYWDMRRLLDDGTLHAVVFTVPYYGPDPFGHDLVLEPLDDARATEWARRWTAHTGSSFDIQPFLRPQGPSGLDDDPVQLARYPLTLLLLAEMHAEGHLLPGTERLRDRAAVYRELVQWSCTRLAREGQGGALRRELRLAAWKLLSLGSDRPFGAEGLQVSMDEVPSLAEPADRSGGRTLFPLVLDDEGSFQFFHPSLMEYLAAEGAAIECSRMITEVADMEGALVPALDPTELAARWLKLFGAFYVTPGVDAFLAALVPTWSRFADGAWGRARAFGEQWARTIATVYRELSDERGFALALSQASLVAPPSQARARALYALLLLGSLPRRRGVRFRPEDDSPGRYPDVARLLGRADVPETPAFRTRLSLAGARWEHQDLRGLDLASLDLRSARLAGARLDGADLADTDLTGADLRGATLRGAVLDHATLDRASLREATLDGASLRGASLVDAVMLDATLRGVELSQEQEEAAIRSREKAATRGVTLSPDVSAQRNGIAAERPG